MTAMLELGVHVGDLPIPVAQAAAETYALLAARGAGKTNTARTFAEEMFRHGLHFVAIDPVGSWWGLTAGREPGQPGLPIPIFGGRHGDVPLERGGGQLVADLVVDERLSCVLDVSDFESEAAKRQFLLDFATRLYKRNEQPLHLFLEEADDFLPQRIVKTDGNAGALLRAWENIVKRGRARGLGCTLITQRSAAINKSVLTQCQTLIAMRTIGPQDVDAIKDWVKYQGAEQQHAILASLPRLESGEAWVWSPQFLKLTKRVRFRLSTTFDSGATPVGGKSTAARPATRADIDLAAIKARMAATIEKAKADDPKALRGRITELERALAEATAALTLPRGLDVRAAVYARLQRVLKVIDGAIKEPLEVLAAEMGDRDVKPENAPLPPPRLPESVQPRPVETIRQKGARLGAGLSEPLQKCERQILTALVQHGGLPLTQAAIAALYSPTAGGTFNAAGRLRAIGLVEGDNAHMTATDSGRRALGSYEPLPVGADLARAWYVKLSKAERLILQAVVAGYPRAVSLTEAAERTNYSPTAGGTFNAAGRLRGLALVTGSNAGMTANGRLVR